MSWLLSAKSNIRRAYVSSGDGFVRSSAFLTRGDLSASAVANASSGNRRERKNEMMKGREKSDGRTVAEGRRKAVQTEPDANRARGGKATTGSEQVGQLGLFRGTADSPQGADGEADAGQPVSASRAVPKPRNTKRMALPAMTMEEVASEENLRMAFQQVASNKGAPGPDRQNIEEVREHIDEILSELRRGLLDCSYRPGEIRRVWISKSSGGQRGLGIPNVVDRIVQQAVHQMLSPHYEPTFHGSSHGFRPGRSCHIEKRAPWRGQRRRADTANLGAVASRLYRTGQRVFARMDGLLSHRQFAESRRAGQTGHAHPKEAAGNRNSSLA
jgi:hypothetical protein